MRGYLLVAIVSLLTSSIGRFRLHIPTNLRQSVFRKELSRDRDTMRRFVVMTNAARTIAGHGTFGTTQSLVS
jgi:hypothetical protein